jgi:predicted small metal-binding protein
MSRRWRCLEPGCGAVVEASSDEELVEAANVHVHEAHNSYELEEVILAGAEDRAPAHEEMSATGRSNT